MHVGNDAGTDTDGAADAVAVDVATVMARARGTITVATRFFIVVLSCGYGRCDLSLSGRVAGSVATYTAPRSTLYGSPALCCRASCADMSPGTLPPRGRDGTAGTGDGFGAGT